ncbi:MAG: T9SS C-terminal target domain-containing protein, partial [Bacteroidetes bacterium]
VLDPSAYLIVWADKDEMQAGLHANFKLSKSGETLWFSHEDGTLIDSLTFGQQITNISSARIPNGSGPIVRQAPTFAADNELVNAVKDPVADDAFRVYPNPASDYVQIRFSPEIKQPKHIRLLNAVGQVMQVEEAVLSDAHTLRVDGLAPGFYWLVAESGKDAWRKKIIIE